MTAAAASAAAGGGRLRAVWLWFATWFAFVAVAHGNFETTDAGFTLYAAKNLLARGDSGFRTAAQGATDPVEQVASQYLRSGGPGKVGRGDLVYTWFPMGHVGLLVPFAVAGDALQAAFPGAEQAFAARLAADGPDGQSSWVEGRPLWTQGLVALVLPAACAATSLLLLLALARQLGASLREALGTALAILLATQAFAFGRETLSDGPGLCFLLGALLAVVAVHQGRGSLGLVFAGGLSAGAAALLRYQNIALLLGSGVALLLACHRQRRWRALAVFTLGTLPAMGLLFAVNFARFGDVFDTGYPRTDDWLTHPLWLGVVKLLFAAGRGVMWFSPLAWLALPLALRARHVPQLRWLAWALFLFPLLFFARALGWQGGQCWGARYVTHGLVALLALVLPQARPWRSWPRTWWLCVGLGAAVAVTSVVAPVRGVQQLANQAAWAEGLVPERGDAVDPISWRLGYTPLLANWRYAFASHAGGFEAATGGARHEARATEVVFGVAARSDLQQRAPVRWEDRCGRHLWWRFWGDLLGVPGLLLLLPVLAAAAVAGAVVWRGLAPTVAVGPIAVSR